MARPLTYDQSESTRLARAGAQSLNSIEDELGQERRYNDQVARQASREARADSREERMVSGAELDAEVTRYHLEKERTMDENAKRMKVETDKQAKEGNEELFKINTADDSAPLKLAEWGAKYFRVLDEKTGDPRLIRQFQINQTRAENARIARSKLDEEKAKEAEKQAAAAAIIAERKTNAEATRKEVQAGGLVPSGATVGDDGKLRTTYAAPDQKKADTYEQFNKDLGEMVKAYGDSTKVPAEKWAEFEAKKAAIGKAPAAERIVRNPATGEKLALRDGKWVAIEPK